MDKKLQRYFCFQLKGRRYAHQTLPQGWACSACMFHSQISNCLSDLPCVCYVDNIIVRGVDKNEHDKNLGLLLERLKKMDLHVNENKMQ